MISALKKIGRKADELLDTRQRARLRNLSAVEQLLFKRVFKELTDSLEETNGRITSKKGFVTLAKAIDRIFDEVEAEHLVPVQQSMATDIGDFVDMNARMYKRFKQPKGGTFEAMQRSVNARLQQRFGISKEGTPMRKGYLDQLLVTNPARDEIKKMVAKAVAGGVPMRTLRRDLAMRITGTDATAGVLEKHLRTFVFDTYQVADSIANNEFADRLGLKYFIYSGGLIETSREFCRKRNNKVFTTEEAKEWPNDPTLPRTKAERDAGRVSDYEPLEDRGRWECRHRLLYIPEEEAFRLRPDLRKGLPAKPGPKVDRPGPLEEVKNPAPVTNPNSDPRGMPRPKATTDPTRIGGAQVPGTTAYELRETHRAARATAQFEVVRPEKLKSIEQFSDADGNLTPERAAMHKEIIADALAGVPRSEAPLVMVMGGGAASGKSTLTRQGAVTPPEHHVLLNPDVFKDDLPEYKARIKAGDLDAAGYAHDESSVINKAVMRGAIKNQQDVLWDGTGNGNVDEMIAKVTKFREAGYKVVANYVTVPTEEAVRRVHASATNPKSDRYGRMVPLTEVRDRHRAVSRVLPSLVAAGIYDEFNLWDTSSGQLIKVASARGKKLVIHERRLWEMFLAKGNEVYAHDPKP